MSDHSPAGGSGGDGSNGAPAALLRRSFRLSGHRTSLSLERIFWRALKDLARLEGRTMTAIIEEVDAQREVALSRAMRVHILQRLQQRSGLQ